MATTGTETAESWFHQLLHPGEIPPEALHGGMTPEAAWSHWCENRAAERAGKPVPHEKLSSAEAWWHGRFNRAHQQEHGAELGRSRSLADREAEREAE